MRRFLILFDKLRMSLVRDGIGSTIRKAVATVFRKPTISDFDRRHGTDTSGIVRLWETSVDPGLAATGERYQAADEDSIRSSIMHLGIDPRRFTFIDLGCGKGLPLLVAAQMEFSKVIGVEFAPELAQTARDNLVRLGIHHGEVITADAGSFDFPAGPLVVFFYNSFQPEVLARVFTRLFSQSGEEVWFIYPNPRHGEFVAGHSRWREIPAGALAPQIRFWKLRLDADPVG